MFNINASSTVNMARFKQPQSDIVGRGGDRLDVHIMNVTREAGKDWDMFEWLRITSPAETKRYLNKRERKHQAGWDSRKRFWEEVTGRRRELTEPNVEKYFDRIAEARVKEEEKAREAQTTKSGIKRKWSPTHGTAGANGVPHGHVTTKKAPQQNGKTSQKTPLRTDTTRERKKNDHYLPLADKLGWRIGRYMESRMDIVDNKPDWAYEFQSESFSDGQALYERNVGDDVLLNGMHLEDADKQIVAELFGGDDNAYKVARQQVWVGCALVLENGVRRIERTSDPNLRKWKVSKEGKDYQERHEGLSLNKAMVQRFFKLDATKMSRTWASWEEWWELPQLYLDNKKKTQINPAWLQLIPSSERKRLMAEAIAWEENDSECKQDPEGMFLEREGYADDESLGDSEDQT